MSQSQNRASFIEFACLLRGLTTYQRRLVWLYAEALGLESKGRRHQCYRLRAMERVFNVSLLKARRRARVGLTDTREVNALEEGFGISPDRILSGDVEALRAGIVAFGKGKG